jgi:hypothetical protein
MPLAARSGPLVAALPVQRIPEVRFGYSRGTWVYVSSGSLESTGVRLTRRAGTGEMPG